MAWPQITGLVVLNSLLELALEASSSHHSYVAPHAHRRTPSRASNSCCTRLAPASHCRVYGGWNAFAACTRADTCPTATWPWRVVCRASCVVLSIGTNDTAEAADAVLVVLAYTYCLYLWTVMVTLCWSMNDFRMPKALKFLSVVLVLGCVRAPLVAGKALGLLLSVCVRGACACERAPPVPRP